MIQTLEKRIMPPTSRMQIPGFTKLASALRAAMIYEEKS
jgi:hypothetical protein